MDIKIYGAVDDNEYKLAFKIKELFENDKELASTSSQIDMISSFQAHGQTGNTDIDLVIIGFIKDYSTRVECKIRDDEEFKNRRVNIQNFVSTIEIKEHHADKVWMDASHIMVKYPEGSHPVTKQSIGQLYSLKGYLRDKGLETPRVSNFIYFPNIKSSQVQFEHKDINVLFSDSTTLDFWHKLSLQQLPKESGGIFYCNSLYPSNFRANHQKYISILKEKIEPSRLDRERMERICHNSLKNQEYVKKLGKQLLIFRGGGGTGKTYRLLKMAINLYERSRKRILLLTYNNALISDIRRLLALLQVPDGYEETVQITSIYSYWRQIFITTGITSKEDYKVDNHDLYIDVLFTKIYDPEESREIATKIRKNADIIYWNYVMVDEAQDWPEKERDILYRIFNHEKIVVADGKYQLIRSKKPCQWEKSTTMYDDKGYFTDDQMQVVPLRKSLRQKSAITCFVNEFASKLGHEWDVESSDLYADGGDIIILDGAYNQRVHKAIINRNRKGKNENIDMLFTVPPSNIINTNGNRSSQLAGLFSEWGYDVWDGVDVELRRGSYPTRLEQLRIVQYDSSRGLEGWICVNIGIDDFFQYKWQTFVDDQEQQTFKTDEQKRREYAAQWLLIPLTRAIDTLIINVENTDSHLYGVLKEIYESKPDWPIEWIKMDEVKNE